MARQTPNLSVAKPKAVPSELRNAMQVAATPATHAEGPPASDVMKTKRRRKSREDTQLIGVHLRPEVGNQLRLMAAQEVTDVKTLLIEAINTLFKSRGMPQIASDPNED